MTFNKSHLGMCSLTRRAEKALYHHHFFLLEIRSVERGICPIATLYSLAAAYKGVGAGEKFK